MEYDVCEPLISGVENIEINAIFRSFAIKVFHIPS